MKNHYEFILKIKEIKDKYDKERNEDRFNIFYALHKEHDEVNLHSRFISYLLAKNSGHKKGDFFARKFFDIILEMDNSFLDEYEVIPNEFNKTEFKEIDILLVSKKLNHAIVIENKIYAKDSNHTNKKEGYNGQLERYYNTILKGVPIENNKESRNNEFSPHNYICSKIDVFYLALNTLKTDSFNISKGNIPEDIGVKEIYYTDKIIEWLKSCLNEIEDDAFLKKIINQYLILVKNMTKTNIPIKELNDLRNLYSTDLRTTQYIIDNFKHIKWHTVDLFLCELEKILNSEGYRNVTLYPENSKERNIVITDLTHNNKDINVGVKFKIDEGDTFYISTLNNLSWGVTESEKWYDFKSNELQNIRFSDFSTINTYNLIAKDNIENAVKIILEEISEEVRK